ncbi:transketolase [Umezawaea sp. NPDC059074]|uniref:transketolase n=1 Tax=Umezawaea sp. NPDC059074 TaxID=3346716 RepID=UPI003674B02E
MTRTAVTRSSRRRSDEDLRRMAWRVRRHALDMVAKEGFGYLGQALSSAEIAAVLYGDALDPDVDRLVLSPGHYAITHYAACAEIGLLDEAELATYGDDGGRLEAIGTERTPGLAATCGSLGQGLSVAAGIALAQRLQATGRRTYAFLSDGEMEEGQVWEAALFAAHHGLSGLTVVLDRNNSQVDGATESVTTLEPVPDKWRAFGWAVVAVDGHDVAALRAAVEEVRADPRPGIVIASTWTLSGLADVIPDEADGHFLKVSADQVDRARVLLDEAERTAAPVRTVGVKGE